MTSTDLEILNLKRQEEIRNEILIRIMEELIRFNENYEKVNRFKLESKYYGGETDEL